MLKVCFLKGYYKSEPKLQSHNNSLNDLIEHTLFDKNKIDSFINLYYIKNFNFAYKVNFVKWMIFIFYTLF